jgi:Ca2+-binding RTX toxin-like protein
MRRTTRNPGAGRVRPTGGANAEGRQRGEIRLGHLYPRVLTMTAEEHVGVALTYEAAPGESNRVAVTMTTNLRGFIVTDTGFDASGPLTLTAGPGCTSVDPQIASCEHNVDDITETPIEVMLVLGDNLVGDLDRAWASDACGPFRPGDDLPCRASVYGGEGVDSVFANDAGEHLVIGADPSTRSEVRGGPGHDALYAGEVGSRLIGGRGDDSLFGGAGKDTISGGGGEDTIRGGLRADELRGQAGADTFYASDGYSDCLFGGKGRDRARVDRGLDLVRSIERFF